MQSSERQFHQYVINSLRPYIMEVFRQRNQDNCALCGQNEGLEIDHKKYGADVTMDDLQLLCHDCHKEQTSIANDNQLAGVCPRCGR